MHPTHDRNIRFFADAADEIADPGRGDSDRRREARSPLSLRGADPRRIPLAPCGAMAAGGAWTPRKRCLACLLLRENSFTTSRFEFEFRDPDSFGERDGGLARAKVEALERFFENDCQRRQPVSGRVPELPALPDRARVARGRPGDRLRDSRSWSTQLLTGKRGYFSRPSCSTGSPANAMIGEIDNQHRDRPGGLGG